jgi:hypothetical protein
MFLYDNLICLNKWGEEKLSKQTEEPETVEVTLQLPKPVADFFKAFAGSNNKTVENMIIEELVTDIEMLLDIEPRMKNLIIHQYDLEKILGVKPK